MTPLLEAHALRVDLGGVPALEGFSLVVAAGSVALAGDVGGLVAALVGRGVVRGGSLALAGAAPGSDAWLARVGVAPLDPPLAPRMAARDHVVAGARLAGMSPRAARRAADAALEIVSLADRATAPLAALSLAERRAIVVAQAIAAEPEVLVLEAPLASLEGAAAELALRAVLAATRGRAWIASVHRLDAASSERALAGAADRTVVLAAGRVVRDAPLAEHGGAVAGVSLVVTGDVAAFGAALSAAGARVVGSPSGRMWVELAPPADVRELLALSLQVGAPIVELASRTLVGAPPVVEPASP